MSGERHVKLFRNGRNQAVRIPREFELPGEDAVMRREGGRLILELAERKETLSELIDRWRKEPPIEEEDWPEIDDPPPEPVDF